MSTLIDFVLHIDEHLLAMVADYGTLVYAILFLIVFVETGLIVMPLLPGDSLLFAAGAIAAANNTEFGLASYFYTRDIGRIYRVGEALEYGMVGVNVGILATEHVPFGGMKQSGLGREGSRHGMTEYLEMKYLCIGDILR